MESHKIATLTRPRKINKTTRMKKVEGLLGGNIDDLLIEAYNRLGSLEAVVDEWNPKLDGQKVDANLLWHWMDRLRIVIARQAYRER